MIVIEVVKTLDNSEEMKFSSKRQPNFKLFPVSYIFGCITFFVCY